MARHWTQYTNHNLSDKQVYALDAMAREHELSDGLAVLAEANGLSRSKAGRKVADRFNARSMVDAAFKQYGRQA